MAPHRTTDTARSTTPQQTFTHNRCQTRSVNVGLSNGDVALFRLCGQSRRGGLFRCAAFGANEPLRGSTRRGQSAPRSAPPNPKTKQALHVQIAVLRRFWAPVLLVPIPATLPFLSSLLFLFTLVTLWVVLSLSLSRYAVVITLLPDTHCITLARHSLHLF